MDRHNAGSKHARSRGRSEGSTDKRSVICRVSYHATPRVACVRQ